MENDQVSKGVTTRRSKEECKEIRRRLKQPRSQVAEEEEDTDLTREFKKAVPALRLDTEQENQILVFLSGFNTRDEQLRREINDIRANLDAIYERARNFQSEITETIGREILETRQK